MRNMCLATALCLPLWAGMGMVVHAQQADDVPKTGPAIATHLDIVYGNDVGYQGRSADLTNADRIELWREEGVRQLDRLSTVGMTSFEPYVKWSLLEPRDGEWDYSYYDALTDSTWPRGLRWTPFIIAGPAYSVPEWFKESSQSVYARCLEHDRDTRTQSIWNPHFLPRVETLLKNISRQWPSPSDYESVLLGITGDFGEAIYPVSGNFWTYIYDPHSDHPNDAGKERYHTHPGFWCGDPYAVQDFRNQVRTTYGRLDILNERWKSQFTDWDNVRPRARSEMPSDEAWLWQVEWYRRSMTGFAEEWLRLARRYFPQTKIFLVTGGHMAPEHGSDFSGNAEICAWMRTTHGQAGIRITNEGSDYAMNFVLTRLVASSCRFYGVPFGFEPAGPVDERGVVARIYNATVSGTDHLFEYGNPLQSPLATERFNRYRELLVQRDPHIDVAVVYPTTPLILGGGAALSRFHERAKRLRSYVDFDFVDERLILAGALDRYSVIVRLDDGALPVYVQRLLDAAGVAGGGVQHQVGDGSQSVEAIGRATQDAVSGRWPMSGETPLVFLSRMKNGEMVFLNMNDHQQTVQLQDGSHRLVSLDPVSITVIREFHSPFDSTQ